jgi:hypothetical protein
MPSGCVSGLQALSNSVNVPGLILRVVIQTMYSSIAASSTLARHGHHHVHRQRRLDRPVISSFKRSFQGRWLWLEHLDVRIPASVRIDPGASHIK